MQRVDDDEHLGGAVRARRINVQIPGSQAGAPVNPAWPVTRAEWPCARELNARPGNTGTVPARVGNGPPHGFAGLERLDRRHNGNRDRRHADKRSALAEQPGAVTAHDDGSDVFPSPVAGPQAQMHGGRCARGHGRHP